MIARSLLIAEYDSMGPVTSVVIPAMMASVEEVEVVVAHSERVTLRAGDVFLEIDADQRRTDAEVEAMAPVPAPQNPVAQAAGARPRRPARDGTGPPRRAICRVAGRVGRSGCRLRTLHDAPLPPFPRPAAFGEYCAPIARYKARAWS